MRRQKLDHFTIKVTKYYDLPEREYQNVLLHEMIHYYIAYQRIKDTSAHGQVFRAMMNELNSRHGWNIKVRVDTRQWAANDQRKGKRRLVLAFRTHDGKHYLAVINGRYFDAIQYLLGKDDTSPIKVEVEAPQQHTDAVGIWKKITYTYEDGCQIILEGEGFESAGKTAYIEGPKGKVYKGFECTIPDIMNKLAEFPDPEPQRTDFLDCC